MSSCLPPLSRFFFLRPKRLAAPPPPAVPVPKTYVYSSPSGVELRVDLYAPSAPITPSPVIIFFHGGQLLYGARDFVMGALRGVCTPPGGGGGLEC
jgi:acetyl esterase/lipase